jgi:predicted DsbA family dithiol-disulfide isomerase
MTTHLHIDFVSEVVIPGGQPPEVFEEALRRIARELAGTTS